MNTKEKALLLFTLALVIANATIQIHNGHTGLAIAPIIAAIVGYIMGIHDSKK